MIYDLQSRWKIEDNFLKYYGLRNAPNMFKNKYRISNRQKAILERLPSDLSKTELRVLKRFVGIQIVPLDQKRKIPKSLSEARFCTSCIANDFIIPGMELDESGRCPMCQTREKTKELKSIVPIKNEFPRSKKSRFDVAVFYTGGKDSTYLLYYLSKKCNLRVLALTWEIPYISESARKSIEGAKRTLDTVEFITRKVSNDDLKAIYKKLYEISGNTCACPSLAYVLFYPELVANRVPYFVAGNEPVQMLGLYYNHIAPKIAYNFPDNKILNFLINIGRIITLHPPLKRGQFHTLATMKQLAYGDSWLLRLSDYRNELVSNITTAIHSVPSIVRPLKKSIRSSSWSGEIPAFVQVDLNEICGGIYDWRAIKDEIVSECGWVSPDWNGKGLHTSCRIEKCKENTQFKRFYEMQSSMIPFSALEISLASRDKNITREAALAELENELGFSLEEIPECAIMKEYL